jgi:hypothetical protein
MVSRRNLFLLLATSVVVLLAACGGKSNDGIAAPTGQSTAVRPASGPTALLDPGNGPPGTEVIVTGSGWPARGEVLVLGGVTPAGPPYATVRANDDGTFTARFRLETLPNGQDLKVGRFNLIAQSGGAQVVLPFQIESRRPVDNAGPGGGGG